MKIGHIHLKVRHLQTAVEFYRKYLDMEITEQLGEAFVFLSSGAMHHELALQEVGRHAALPKRHDVGLYHVAFEVPDKCALANVYRKLRQDGVAVYPVDHRISWALYFNDPDGNGLEVYWDTRTTPHGAVAWQGVDRPLTEAQLSA